MPRPAVIEFIAPGVRARNDRQFRLTLREIIHAVGLMRRDPGLTIGETDLQSSVR